MESKASVRYLRVSPMKARQVADLVRGKDLKEAYGILRYSTKKTSPWLFKLINSAAANAETNFDMNVDKLYVSEIRVDEGPSFKRLNPRAHGRADIKKHRTSHISVVLKEREVK